jgi:hypothetical protein
MSLGIDLNQDQQCLYDKLSKWRYRTSLEKKIEPFKIFSNESLRWMAKICPTLKDDLLAIKGVGPKKFEWYGLDLLAITIEHKFGINPKTVQPEYNFGLCVFVLALKNGHYYIGHTSDMKKTFSDCLSGQGPEWTRLWPVIEVCKLRFNCQAAEEEKFLLLYMTKYGIENVRSSVYCDVELTPDQRHTLLNELEIS